LGRAETGKVVLLARELVSLNPDVLFAVNTPAVRALQQEPEPYQLSLLRSPIQSVKGLLPISLVPAATSRVLRTVNLGRQEN